jgi:transcriptional regulator with PAS, ATPase and Fis domain
VFQEKNQNILVNRMPVKNAEGQIEGFISQLFSVGKSDWQGIWKKIEQAEKTLRYLQQEAGQFNSHCSELIVGKSPALLRCMEKLTSYATTELPVLITGDTGVGKELFANAIHRNSRYANGPLVTINCSSFPAELTELNRLTKGPCFWTSSVTCLSVVRRLSCVCWRLEKCNALAPIPLIRYTLGWSQQPIAISRL